MFNSKRFENSVNTLEKKYNVDFKKVEDIHNYSIENSDDYSKLLTESTLAFADALDGTNLKDLTNNQMQIIQKENTKNNRIKYFIFLAGIGLSHIGMTKGLAMEGAE